MPLFSNRSYDDLILILDVQSSIVRGSLVLMKVGANPHILFTYSLQVPFSRSNQGNRLIKATITATVETIEAVTRHFHIIKEENRNLPRKIKEVHYVLSSPWIMSQAKKLDLKFEKNIVVTKQRILQMIKEERVKMTAKPEEEIKVIEEKIFDVELNGYSITDWEGKTTQSLGVSFVASIAGTGMIDKFKDACLHVCHRDKIFFHSSLLLQYIGIQQVMPKRDSYGLIHIHGELTDIVIVDHHTCVFFGTFPLGLRTMIRLVSTAIKSDEHAADSLISIYADGVLDKSTKSNIQVVEEALRMWNDELKKTLERAQFPANSEIPVIVSSLVHENFFAKSLSSDLPKAIIELLSIEEIAKHVSYDVHTERLRTLGLFAVAIHNIAKV